MTRPRTALLSFCLLALGVVGAGFYARQHLPELLQLLTQRALAHYGVTRFDIEGLQFTDSTANIDTVILAGTYDTFAYQARLSASELHFRWRDVVRGELASLSVADLEMSVTQTASGEKQALETLTVEDWLPQQWLAQLPLNSVRIAHWRLVYHTPGLEEITATGRLIVDEQLDVQLEMTLAERAVHARLQSGGNAGSAALDMSLQGDHAVFATLSARLARTAADNWGWDLQGQAQFAPLLAWLRDLNEQHALALAIPGSTDFVVQGQTVLTARIEHPNTLQLKADSDATTTLPHGLTADLRLENQIQRLDIAGLIEEATGSLDVALALDDAAITGSLAPVALTGALSTNRLSLPASWPKWIGWGDTVPVQLETPEAVKLAFAEHGDWSVKVPDALISLGEKDSRLSIQQLNLELGATGQAQWTTQLSARLNTRLRKQTMPQLDLALKQQGTWQHSAFTLQLGDTSESFSTTLQGTANLSDTSGDYQLRLDIADLSYFTATSLPLLQHFDLLENTVAIRSGSVGLTSTVHSTGGDIEKWTQRSRVLVKNVSGSVDDYSFERLTASTEWSGITRWTTLQPLSLSLDALNPGFAMRDIRVQLSLPNATPIARPKVRIEAFTARVFGGEMALPDTQAWDFAAPANQLTVTASHWQLAELVALQQNADIEAEGTLEGKLPLTVADGRISIEEGYLRALAPGGSIRYHPNKATQTLAKGNSELALALNLLSDFHYQVLSSEVQLDRTGNLLLALSLAGSNPAQYEGQPVNFNINVEQNLDPLLQSLRLSGNLVKRIEGTLK